MVRYKLMSTLKNHPLLSYCALQSSKNSPSLGDSLAIDCRAVSVQSATRYSGPEDSSAIFHQALTFTKRISEDPRLRRKIKQEMEMIDEQQELVVEVITPPPGSANSPTSFAGTVPKNSDFGAACLDKDDEFLDHSPVSTASLTLQVKPQKKSQLMKKPSIMSEEWLEMGEPEGWGQDSDEAIVLQLDIPDLKMDQTSFQALFEETDPFLITLSLCLWVRWELSQGEEGSGSNSGWSLCIATMLAHKVAFDDTLSGIVQYYGEVIGVSKEQMMGLERLFLEQIDYNTVIRNYQYHVVLSQLLTK